MPKIPFSKVRLDALVPGARRVRYMDERTPHLALYVLPSGAKAFYYYRKSKGVVSEVKIGDLADINIFLARQQVETINARLTQGLPAVEPVAEPSQAPLTFGELFESYMVNHARPHTRTWKSAEGYYLRDLQDWADVPAADVDPKTVAAKLTAVRSRAPIAANRLLGLIRRVYNYAIDGLDLDVRNPTRRAKATHEEPRRRYLDRAEAARFVATLDKLAGGWRAVDSEERRDWEYWRAFFMLLLYTGARRGMLQRMEWGEINLQDQTWIVPGAKMKAKRDAVIVLSAPACAILGDRPREGRYVFPGRSGDVPVQEIKGAWTRLCELAKLDRLRPHDLRRTFGTWQLQAGAATETVRDTLSQSDLRVTQASYAHVHTDAVRASVEQMAEQVRALRPPQ